MEIYAVSRKYIAFSVPFDEFLGPSEAEQFTREILEEKLLPQWEQIHFDVFTNENKALYLAYPEEEIQIRIAPYALPIIKEYFTE